jgi:hypothetical protein
MRRFIIETVLKSKIVLRAGERLQYAQNFFNEVEIWCSIQSILVAADNVSKHFGLKTI